MTALVASTDHNNTQQMNACDGVKQGFQHLLFGWNDMSRRLSSSVPPSTAAGIDFLLHYLSDLVP